MCIRDRTNGTATTVGPWNYTGTGTNFSVTLTGQPFGLGTAGATFATNFAVTLLDGNKTHVLNYTLPTGLPITLEAPIQYFSKPSNYLACQTFNEDGNCGAFNFNYYLISPLSLI